MYRQRAKEIAAKSIGLERYLYRIFGSDLMGSIACAFDPWARFRFPVVKITPRSRNRIIPGITAKPRFVSHTWKQVQHSFGTYAVPYDSYVNTASAGTGLTAVTSQLAIPGFCIDTTRRTRGIDSEYGEFELYVPKFDSSNCENSYNSEAYVWNDNYTYGFQSYYDNRVYHNTRVGPCFRMPKSQVTSSACYGRATTAMSKYGLGLVGKSLPTSRRFNLAYQVGELKDVPQMLRGTVQAWKSFESLVGKEKFVSLLSNPSLWSTDMKVLLHSYARSLNIYGLDKELSNAYLCYKFGWASVVQAVSTLLDKPARVAADINRLIARNGMATSFRSGMSWIEKDSSPPCADFDFATGENIISYPTATGVRECLLRCVVNATFEFPTVDIPKLRTNLIVRKYGADPRPSDIYDLIPWTWLIDWFSGIGDYIHIMDTLLEDKSLINFGFLTYREISRSTTTVKFRTSSDWYKVINGSRTSGITYVTDAPSAVFEAKYVLRLSLASVAGIKTPSSSSLTNGQKTILGALASIKIHGMK
jgi:hypothetical protein